MNGKCEEVDKKGEIPSYCQEVFLKKSSIFSTFWAVVAVIIGIICVVIAWAFAISKDVTSLKTKQELQEERIVKIENINKDVDTVKSEIRTLNHRLEVAKIIKGK